MGINLTVFDRYIAREIIVACLTVLFVFEVIVISTETVHLLRWLAEGRIPADSFFSFLLNSVMEYAITLLPFSLFLGVLLAFGRLYKDSEMAAIMSAGAGPLQWNRPVLLVAVPVSLIILFLFLYISPLVSKQRDDIKVEIYNRAEGSQFSAGQFNASRSGKSTFFMESSDDSGKMNSVFHSNQNGEESYIDIAESATRYRQSKDRLFTVMHNGHQYIGNPGEANYRILEYEEYAVLMPGAEKRTLTGIQSEPTHVLWESDSRIFKVELLWRITVPLAALISALIAVPLSHTSPRGGRFAKMALAMLVYLVYSNMLGVGKTWLFQGVVPLWVGIWWVHLAALFGLSLLWYQGGYFGHLSLFKRRVTQ